MHGRLRAFSGHGRIPLTSGWEIASAAVELSPPEVAALAWRPIPMLNTVAAALRARGEWSVDGPVRRFDAEDWWYRLRFDSPSCPAGTRLVLGFDGLATVARAWLNGTELLASDNMFLAHEVPLDAALLRASGNELLLRFRSLDALLAAKRPRPRWRTPMVEHQQLRWFRTTLLGRTPGWSPPAPPVGPWRGIWLEARTVTLDDVRLRARVENGTGILDCSVNITTVDATASAEIVITGHGMRQSVALTRGTDGRHAARLELPAVKLWWPHTHGEPALYDCALRVETGNGAAPLQADLGRVGFRTLELDTREGDFAIRVNGVAVFCRGACWTPLDCAAPGDDGGVEAALARVRAAGMNMLRVGGTMVYESDRFLDACDANGILLWQDFMFASMDYPVADAAFTASVRRECEQLLARLAARPCAALLCGNSEAGQQAAMWGTPRESWSHPLFEESLREWTRASDVTYWPSSTHGGAFPHQPNTGSTSYYGVGAYRRPLEDARRAELRFAAECLGFANVPEDATLDAMGGGTTLHAHHPAWKARVPRDLGAAWDFDDIRDHYFRTLLGVDPLEIRYSDRDRFLDLSRVVSGEVMSAAFREWRRRRSTCRGALVWFLRDLWRGAGWGIVDSDGLPKAPYYFLRRALQPRTAMFSDEGVNGLAVHVINEAPTELRGTLRIEVFRHGGARVAQQAREVRVGAHDALEFPAAAMFEGFTDLNYAYRFGPLAHEVVCLRLQDADGGVLAEDFHFPAGLTAVVGEDVGLSAQLRTLSAEAGELTLHTRACARHVVLRGSGLESEDQYFHLAPGSERRMKVRLIAGVPFQCTVRALNSSAIARIEIR